MFAPPAVDVSAGLVYGTLGNPYREPASVAACNAAAPNGFSESCEQPGSYFESIVAFDLATGQPHWSYRVWGHSAWQSACGSQPATVTWCAPEADHEKWDLGGSGANVFRIGHRDVVGVGGKSGVYYTLDARTGELVWNTLVGPGGDQGGFEWGTAYDGKRIYVSLTNHHHIPYQLTENGVLSSTTATGGSWVNAAPAIVDGSVYWGSGYSRSGVEGSGNTKLYGFGLALPLLEQQIVRMNLDGGLTRQLTRRLAVVEEELEESGDACDGLAGFVKKVIGEAGAENPQLTIAQAETIVATANSVENQLACSAATGATAEQDLLTLIGTLNHDPGRAALGCDDRYRRRRSAAKRRVRGR